MKEKKHPKFEVLIRREILKGRIYSIIWSTAAAILFSILLMIAIHNNITSSLVAIKNSTEKILYDYTNRLLHSYYYPHFNRVLKDYHHNGIPSQAYSIYTISPTTTYTPTYKIISTTLVYPNLEIKITGITHTSSGTYEVIYIAGQRHPIYNTLRSVINSFNSNFPYISGINIYTPNFTPIIETASIPKSTLLSLVRDQSGKASIHTNLIHAVSLYKLHISNLPNSTVYMVFGIKTYHMLYILFIIIGALTVTIFISLYTTFKLAKELAHKLALPLEKIINSITKLKPPYEDSEHILEAAYCSYAPEELILMLEKIKEMITANKRYLRQLENEKSKTLLAYDHANKREKELYDAYYTFATTLARIAEKHDDTTGKHIQRVGEISGFIAEKMKLPSMLVDQIRKFAPLHDIGKIMVPDSILQKKGPLTEEEWEIMKKHTQFGAELLGNKSHFMVARNIALYHHEKYDGSGYPFGIKGNQIPIEAQIVALADIYDALRDERPYKPALTHDEAVKIILYGDNRTKPQHFNPQILEIFKRYHKTIEEIYKKLQ